MVISAMFSLEPDWKYFNVRVTDVMVGPIRSRNILTGQTIIIIIQI